METGPLKFGKDTWVGSGKPNANHNDANRIKLKSGDCYGFVHCKNPVPGGLTVVEATYTMYVAKPAEWAGTKMVKLRKTAERVPFGKMTWNNKPGVSGANQPTATVTDPVAGQAVQFDVTAHIQNTAGEPWYGWRVETDSATAHRFYGYESDYPPVLEVTYALSPSQPVDLVPSGGDVSVQFPVFTFDAADLENPEDMVALRIQIAAPGAARGSDGLYTAPAFDTGEVPATTPYWESAGSAWAGIAAGGAVEWIALYKSGDGVWGDPSDPYQFGRTDKGTVTITNPAAPPNNFVEEATPPFIHSFTGTQVAWRKFVTLADDPTEVVANSRKQDGTDTSWTPPKKKLQEGVEYDLHTRVWDDVDRVASPGDPLYVEAVRRFTFQHDPTIDRPVMVSAVQDGATPFVKITVTRTSAPDSWTLLMDGDVVDADIDPADTLTTGTSHDICYAGATPHEPHVFEVRAVVNGKASGKSDPATVTILPEDVWLLDYDRARYVRMIGAADVEKWRRTDQVGVFYPISHLPVQIHAGSNGYAGPYEGSLANGHGRTTGQWRADFEWMAERAARRTYQLVAAHLSLPVRIRNASATPHSQTRGSAPRDRVFFEFIEAERDDD